MDSTEFKQAMSNLASGVSVISTLFDGQLFGFTASSLTSVSLNPPLILFCLNQSAGSFFAFQNSQNFGISILSENQADISQHFAGYSKDQEQTKEKFAAKFDQRLYMQGIWSRCPLILDALCWIECQKVAIHEAGDHFIFVSKVIRAYVNDHQNQKPLIYFNKHYRKL